MPNINHLSRVLIISNQNNVTLDYYIKPRLSKEAMEKMQIINPQEISINLILPAEQKIAVIINRYFSIKLLRWIFKFEDQIEALIWVVDDDYPSMLKDRSIPPRIKRRPLVTLWLYPFIRRHIDLLIASTKEIPRRYSGLPNTIQPPIFDLSISKSKPLNRKKLYYFAKMHKAEHEFLYPIIKEVLKRDPELSFTVIATGDLKELWETIPGVVAIPEMPYPQYCDYIEALSEGGLFLVPLLQSSLNRHRSYAKLLEVARTSSSPILAQHEEFETCLKGCGIKFLPANPDHWINAIIEASSQNGETELRAKKLRERLAQIYEGREMIL